MILLLLLLFSFGILLWNIWCESLGVLEQISFAAILINGAPCTLVKTYPYNKPEHVIWAEITAWEEFPKAKFCTLQMHSVCVYEYVHVMDWWMRLQ